MMYTYRGMFVIRQEDLSPNLQLIVHISSLNIYSCYSYGCFLSLAQFEASFLVISLYFRGGLRVCSSTQHLFLVVAGRNSVEMFHLDIVSRFEIF